MLKRHLAPFFFEDSKIVRHVRGRLRVQQTHELQILTVLLSYDLTVFQMYLCTMQFQFHNIILFDGVCNLCNSSVQFVIRHDKEATFKFASLQSEFGQKILREEQLPVDDLRSFILIENGKVYTRSTAALRVARRLNGGWPLLYGLMIIPRFIRDAVYDLIAKNRYKWFGKQEACWVPTPELKNRLIEN